MSHRLNGNSRVEVDVVRCPGDLNANRMAQMKSRFSRLINQNRRRVIFDLKEARHADLAGLGILVDRIRRIRLLNGDIRLVNLHPEVTEIFRMIGLNQVIASFASEEEARRSFQVA